MYNNMVLQLKNICRIVFPRRLFQHYLINASNEKIILPLPQNFWPIEPLVYNSDGQRMRFFFIRDESFSHVPNSGLAKRILWDRYNIGLENHFYTNHMVLKTIGRPNYKYAWIRSSGGIEPEVSNIFPKHPGLEEDFDLIFTHSAMLLDKYPNARFCPPATVWYGNIFGEGCMDPLAYKNKIKNISMCATSKNMCPLHQARKQVALRLKQTKQVDTFGDFDGGSLVPIAHTLSEYRYSIAVENFIEPYYFTEKILNCFAAMTVPIYIGATNISEFFNMDGIIQIKSCDYSRIEKVIMQCNESDYKSRIAAIKDNYERVQKFITPEDYIYEHYFSKLF